MNKGAGSGSCPHMRSGFLYIHYRCEYRVYTYICNTPVIHRGENTYAFTNRYCLNTLKTWLDIYIFYHLLYIHLHDLKGICVHDNQHTSRVY